MTTDHDPDIVIRDHPEFAHTITDLAALPGKVTAAASTASAASAALASSAAAASAGGTGVQAAMTGLTTALAKAMDESAAQAVKGSATVTSAADELRALQSKVIARGHAGAETIIEA
jgi:hypothetical protein